MHKIFSSKAFILGLRLTFGILGGYLLAALISMFLALLIPHPINGILLGMLVSLLCYPLVLLWLLASPKLGNSIKYLTALIVILAICTKLIS